MIFATSFRRAYGGIRKTGTVAIGKNWLICLKYLSEYGILPIGITKNRRILRVGNPVEIRTIGPHVCQKSMAKKRISGVKQDDLYRRQTL